MMSKIMALSLSDCINLFFLFPHVCLYMPKHFIHAEACMFIHDITQTCPCNILQYLTTVKVVIPDEKCDFYLIFAQNIYRGYTLEPPR